MYNKHDEQVDWANRIMWGMIWFMVVGFVVLYFINEPDDDPSFNDYECTIDCSGHEAGYEWAESNDITDEEDCSGYSESFIEGCRAYVEDN